MDTNGDVRAAAPDVSKEPRFLSCLGPRSAIPMRHGGALGGSARGRSSNLIANPRESRHGGHVGARTCRARGRGRRSRPGHSNGPPGPRPGRERPQKCALLLRLTPRNAAKRIIMGGNHINFGLVAGPPNVHDFERGRRRATTGTTVTSSAWRSTSTPSISSAIRSARPSSCRRTPGISIRIGRTWSIPTRSSTVPRSARDGRSTAFA